MIRKVTEIINHSMSGRKSGDNDISIVVFEDDPSLHFACLMQISPRWTDNGDSLLKGLFRTEFVCINNVLLIPFQSRN